ncbi:peptidase M16 inactive domain protein [bacterium BMS3Abin02]|nr:peptidase M16 inactive domain protein [bacterium BMS3Abin02]GBE21428.1 peptidase M16 inactive domain protein [bacterium BMS3Bbin01]HDH26646.1 insulinase family protein [Actinomycetota bacterium]HDK45388.1 insulinase family protein [Actinomycetota bacterium]HDL49613.1 insulinase family protein [Actinomycetota bacterium]
MSFDRTVLHNGLTVITEAMTGIRSVAVGIWVDTGTRDELATERGASHFLEHLLFKGTDELGSLEISRRFDAIGAEANAFTSKDSTCFWVRLLDEDLAEGLGLLAQMLQRPAFRPGDVDSERDVVIEEINMNDDDPGDLAHEQFFRAVFSGHPLEHPVLGSKASVKALTPELLERYWRRRYRAGSTVLAVAGNLDHRRVVDLAGRLFGVWDGGSVTHSLEEPPADPGVRAVRRETEQVHVVLGGRGLVRGDDRRYAFGVLDSVLGGTASSRLFRTIREDRGLAYSVYSFRAAYADAGAYGVYAGTTARNVGTVLDLANRELANVARNGVTDEELARAKGGMRGSMALALEDPNSRMVRLGKEEIAGMEHLSVDQRIARLNAVTADDVHEVAEVVLTGPRTLGVVGPFDTAEVERFL